MNQTSRGTLCIYNKQIYAAYFYVKLWVIWVLPITINRISDAIHCNMHHPFTINECCVFSSTLHHLQPYCAMHIQLVSQSVSNLVSQPFSQSLSKLKWWRSFIPMNRRVCGSKATLLVFQYLTYFHETAWIYRYEIKCIGYANYTVAMDHLSFIIGL